MPRRHQGTFATIRPLIFRSVKPCRTIGRGGACKSRRKSAEAFAHNFLGLRLQCAQCHKHPFAPWTQDDFQQFSRFFENVKFGVAPDAESRYRGIAEQVGLKVGDKIGTAIGNEVLKHARDGRTIPWRELYVSQREESAALRLLRSRTVELEGDDDPREAIMHWMSEPDNPWFARASL